MGNIKISGENTLHTSGWLLLKKKPQYIISIGEYVKKLELLYTVDQSVKWGSHY